MSFSNEMKDFFAAFNTTSAVAGKIQDRKLKREELEAKKANTFPYTDVLEQFPGATAPTLPSSGDAEVVDDDDDDEETPLERADTGEAAIEVPPVMERDPKVYPPGVQRMTPPMMNYSTGGRVRIGTQKGRLPVDMSKMNKDLLNRWAKTQKDFGREFNIVSAYRSPKRNKKAGGAKKSQHMHGNAIDIDVSGLSKPERLKLIQTASANGMTGIGVYNNSLHFDVGGRRAWGPDYSSKSMPGWAKDTIGQHLSGKFGGGSRPDSEGTRSGSAVAGTRGGAKIPSALPVETEVATSEPSWRDRARERLAGGEEEETALPMDVMAGMAGGEEEQDPAALAAFYSNEGIDIGDIDIPEGSRPYTPVNMSAAPPVTGFAAGGSVPWAGQSSYVRRRPGTMGGTFQRRPYVPRQSSPVKQERERPEPAAYTDLIKKYGQRFGMDYVNFAYAGGMGEMAFNPMGSLLASPMFGDFYGNWKRGSGAIGFAEGGAVPDEPEEETAIHQEEIAATTPAPAIPDRTAPPAAPTTSAGKKVSLGQAIDLGLKHLTGALGLDKSGAAVGPDTDLRKRRAALVRGDISAGEPPPTPKEIDMVFKTVDPSGELDNNLRTIYAMRKGVEFYLTRGQPDKAGKWAAGLIQFSNLVSKQYGIEAVKAGKAGDMEGMIQLAVKSYDAIPDGLNVSAKLNGGAVSVTRTDEEGNVVDTHRLTPQQVFQMATGISQGSGYFDALMQVADPTGKKGSGTSGQKGAVRAANLSKLLPDLKADLEPGELEAWEDATESGDDKTLNDIIKAVQGRRKERAKDAEYDEREKARDRRIEEARKASETALDKRLAASEENLTTRLTAAEERQAARDRARDERDEATRKREVDGMVDLFPDYEADMTPAQRRQWENGVATNNPKAMERVLDQIETSRKVAKSDETLNKRLDASDKALEKRIAAQEEALGRRLTAQERSAEKRAQKEEERRNSGAKVDTQALNALYDDLSAKMTEGEKKAWKIAVDGNRPQIIRDIVKKYSSPDELQAMLDEYNSGGEASGEEGGSWWGAGLSEWLFSGYGDGEDAPAEEAIPTAPARAATSESNAGRPMPPEIKAKAMQAIRDGRSRAGVIRKLQEQGYNPAGL